MCKREWVSIYCLIVFSLSSWGPRVIIGLNNCCLVFRSCEQRYLAFWHSLLFLLWLESDDLFLYFSTINEELRFIEGLKVTSSNNLSSFDSSWICLLFWSFSCKTFAWSYSLWDDSCILILASVGLNVLASSELFSIGFRLLNNSFS